VETHEPTDERLIQTALAGDDEAFAALVRRYRPRVFGIAGRFAGNDHELDDVCQEIFIKAYRNLGRYRGDAPFEHWLSRIATRACYDLLRRRRPTISLEHIELPVEDNARAPARAGDSGLGAGATQRAGAARDYAVRTRREERPRDRRADRLERVERESAGVSRPATVEGSAEP
jgi:RNA polymerase sigma-70 factor (ECF subfamily)